MNMYPLPNKGVDFIFLQKGWGITIEVKNKYVNEWVNEVVQMTKPSKIVFIDGSFEQLDALRQEALKTGELIKLNEELLPDCYLHRSSQTDVARVEDRTFICTETQEKTGPINNWMKSEDGYKMLKIGRAHV